MHREVNFSLSSVTLITDGVKQNLKEQLSLSLLVKTHILLFFSLTTTLTLKIKAKKKENKIAPFLTTLENESFESKTIP